LPLLKAEKKFATLEGRKENEEELEKLVTAWTTNQSDKDVMMKMQEVGIGAGMIGTPEDYMENDPQIKYREFYKELDHPEIGRYRAPRQPCVLSKTPCEIRRAPLMGEHNEYALKEILGKTEEEIAQMVIDGVIQ